MKRVCACGCGKEFEPKPNQKFYNKDCRKHARRAYRKRYLKRYRPAYAEKRRRANREYIHAVLAERGCEVCGEKQIHRLDFHHRDPSEKEFAIGRMGGHSRARIDKEIAKCDVLCKNHHADADLEQRRN